MKTINKLSVAFGLLALTAVATANWTFFWPTSFGKISRDELQESLGLDDNEFKQKVEAREFSFYFYDHRTGLRTCQQVTPTRTITRSFEFERLESGDLVWEPVVRFNKDGTRFYNQLNFVGVQNPVVIAPKLCPSGWDEISVTPLVRNRYLIANGVRIQSVLSTNQ